MACWYQNRPQDAQKGRPARPLSDARTPLADFFRILLDEAQTSHEFMWDRTGVFDP